MFFSILASFHIWISKSWPLISIFLINSIRFSFIIMKTCFRLNCFRLNWFLLSWYNAIVILFKSTSIIILNNCWWVINSLLILVHCWAGLTYLLILVHCWAVINSLLILVNCWWIIIGIVKILKCLILHTWISLTLKTLLSSLLSISKHIRNLTLLLCFFFNIIFINRCLNLISYFNIRWSRSIFVI